MSRIWTVLLFFQAPILKAPLPNPSLQNHLKACTNLVAFVGRVTQNYFPQTALEYEKKLKKKAESEAEPAASETTSLSPLAKLRSKDFLNRFASCLVASVAMIAYAHFSGLIDAVRNAEVTFIDINDEEEESDSDDDY